MISQLTIQWLLVIISSLILFAIAPWSKTNRQFFSASGKKGAAPGLFMLTSSLVISWIFAKSITNAANLGLEFGIVGGLAYAAYYFSFLVAGIVIYQLRVRGGFGSIHQFLYNKFGRGAIVVFTLLISFRLMNEVWSNTMVIGTYFGDKGSASYYASIITFTILTLAYALKGGLRSSLLTDAIQMVLFGFLLIVILSIIMPSEGMSTFVASGSWGPSAGLSLLFAALIQCLSYPFHDPVLTDRAFITSPKTMRKAFLFATLIGFVCILLFSFVGIYAKNMGMEGQAAVEVSQSLGVVMMLVMNFIMITSAASTLDSTFASFSKLMVVDISFGKKQSVSMGRWVMVMLAIIGTVPVFIGGKILSATTISGTMVIGLAPVFLLWNVKVPKISFYLTISCGVICGVILTFDLLPKELMILNGAYGDLFTINLIGTALCFLLFLMPKWLKIP